MRRAEQLQLTQEERKELKKLVSQVQERREYLQEPE